MCPIHTAPEKFKNESIPGYFGFEFEENSVEEITDYGDAIVFEKLRRFQNVFLMHQKLKAGVLKFLWVGKARFS